MLADLSNIGGRVAPCVALLNLGVKKYKVSRRNRREHVSANLIGQLSPCLRIAFLLGWLQNLGREQMLGGRKRQRGAVSYVSKTGEGMFDCPNRDSPSRQADS